MVSGTRQLEKYRRGKLSLERGLTLKKGALLRMCLVFPNAYFVGMSNLAVHILYSILNSREDCICERSFCEEPLTGRSLETGSPLGNFHIIAFSVSFELDYVNVLSTLIAANIPLLSSQRDESHPLIIAGGPCIFSNPEPLADCIDLFVIGEGEEIINEVLDEFSRARKRAFRRASLLRAFSRIPGIYVPSLYSPVYSDNGYLAGMERRGEADLPVMGRVVSDLDRHPCTSAIITPETEFGNMILVELGRGCRRGCKFCSACHTYLPRFRSLGVLKDQILAAENLSKRVGLVTSDLADYPQKRGLIDFLLERGFGFSASSIRADAITDDLLAGIRAAGQKTLTLAPEVATKRLAALTGKRITMKALLRSVTLALDHGIPNLRLYFMIGLPGEDDDDIEAIADLASRVHGVMRTAATGTRRMGRLTLSVNPFVPKPFTPLENVPVASSRELSRRIKILRHAVARIPNTKLNIESPRMARLQCALARGDRRILQLAMAVAGGESVAHAMRKFSKRVERYVDAQENGLRPWHTIQPPIASYRKRELN